MFLHKNMDLIGEACPFSLAKLDTRLLDVLTQHVIAGGNLKIVEVRSSTTGELDASLNRIEKRLETSCLSQKQEHCVFSSISAGWSRSNHANRPGPMQSSSRIA